MLARRRRRRRRTQDAKADLTAMIDVTFQLLIFFILCTRFKTQEQHFQNELPKDEGNHTDPLPIPKEQLTIYCNYDQQTGANDYVLAIGARGRKTVPGTRATLNELVIFARDGNDVIREKKALYADLHHALVLAMKDYVKTSGAKIEKFEISFAKDATQGARSGTAPWMFVTVAIDAAAAINKERNKAGQPQYPLTFKFADAMGRYR